MASAVVVNPLEKLLFLVDCFSAMEAANVEVLALVAGRAVSMCAQIDSIGRWAALAILTAALAMQATTRAQGPSGDCVEQLRHALEVSYDDLSSRDRSVKQCLAALHSLADMQRAIVLVEWRESFPDAATTAIDRANQKQLIEWFSVAVRRVLRQGDPPATAAMIDSLAEMAETLRASGGAIDIVRRFGSELAEIVKHGPPSQRAAAARTLAQIEAPIFVAAPALTDLLHAEDEELRLAAADGFTILIHNALQAVGSGAAIQRPAPRGELVLTASNVLPAVHHGLDDTRPEVRCRCLKTIGLAADALTKLCDDSSARRTPQAEYEEVRPLLLALRDQGPILARSLGDADAAVRIRAHKALEEIGLARQNWARRQTRNGGGSKEDLLGEALQQALPGLSAALGHTDVQVRRSALDALETCGPLALPILPALTRALHDPDRFVRWSAIRIVGKLGPSAAPQALSDLTRLLRDPDLGLRKAAATALARLRPTSPAAATENTTPSPR